MHGRKRRTKEVREAGRKEKEKKIVACYTEVDKLLICNDKLVFEGETWVGLGGGDTLQRLENATDMNAEIQSLWNLRRKVLISRWRPKLTTSGVEANEGENEQSDMVAVEQTRGAEGTAAEGTAAVESTSLIDSAITAMVKEMGYTARMLRICPKVYTVWFQRLWCLKQLLLLRLCAGKNGPEGRDAAEICLREELSLCEEFFSHDDRNFHCWNHRQFLCTVLQAIMQLGEHTHGNHMNESERVEASGLASLLYNKKFPGTNILQLSPRFLSSLWKGSRSATVEKLNEAFSRRAVEASFSNFSAWHLRSGLPQELVSVEEELQLVRQGLYTEPNDQSLWHYYWWLLFDRTRAKTGHFQADGNQGEMARELLSVEHCDENERERHMKELDQTEELLELEPDCKYALLTKCLLLERLSKQRGEGEADGIRNLYKQMAEIDPKRRSFYNHKATRF
eukprot:GHVS01084896.1.p1 GENE.GHVS01084896.1~~GHVS01084896.1.p1  ORF type:complete len:452 (-),score=77.86 GHVS01084896.1:402-1757(-)